MSGSAKTTTSWSLKTTLFSFPFIVGSLNQYAAYLVERAIERRAAFSVLPATMNEMMSALKSSIQASKIAAFDELIPDGMPLVWIQRLKGAKGAGRLYGPDLLRTVCEYSQGKNCSHYFYGGTPDSLNKLIMTLNQEYPALQVAGYSSPSFNITSSEINQEITRINTLKPDFIWVGLGGEKQVNWINEAKPLLKQGCIVAVGAAFDFVGGTKHQAPLWVRNAGFEWLFRLVTEPGRLWRRYILQIPPFIIFCIFEVLKNPSLDPGLKERN